VVCPWCFLGKKRLEAALEALKITDAEIRYLPFELNPATPPEGLDHKSHLAAKYGESAIQQSHERLKALGKEAGINYHFEKISRIPNTFNAHRILWLAEKEGVQKEVKEAFLKAYFSDGKDLGDNIALIELAAGAGLDRTKTENLLKSREGEEEVRGRRKRPITSASRESRFLFLMAKQRFPAPMMSAHSRKSSLV
jgi:predicted DsbA family dithiol-disulfide isomerase